MQIFHVQELWLEVWVENQPPWETRLSNETGRPTFVAESPPNYHPPTVITYASWPDEKVPADRLHQMAGAAIRRASENFGVSRERSLAIPVRQAQYGDIQGYEGWFTGKADGVAMDVSVFAGQAPGKFPVVFNVYTTRGQAAQPDRGAAPGLDQRQVSTGRTSQMNKRMSGSLTWMAMSCATLLYILPAVVHAQAVDAPRYINAQGVEVIQGRRAAKPAPAASLGGESGSDVSGPASGVQAMPKKVEPARAMAISYQIAAGEQQQRDRDRLGILEEEMRAENVALESKIRVLQDPTMRAKLDADQRKRLQETTLEHEKNIRALHSEIARAKKNR